MAGGRVNGVSVEREALAWWRVVVRTRWETLASVLLTGRDGAMAPTARCIGGGAPYNVPIAPPLWGVETIGENETLRRLSSVRLAALASLIRRSAASAAVSRFVAAGGVVSLGLSSILAGGAVAVVGWTGRTSVGISKGLVGAAKRARGAKLNELDRDASDGLPKAGMA